MNTPKINEVLLNDNSLKKSKPGIEIAEDFEIGENLKKLIEKTIIEILEKYEEKKNNEN